MRFIVLLILSLFGINVGYSANSFFSKEKCSEIQLHNEGSVENANLCSCGNTIYTSVEDTYSNSVYLSLKTNGLYDVLLIPNIGIEVAFKQTWSISTNWMYAWWSNDKKHNFWRIYGGNLELRYWLGRKAQEKPLQGHHVGVYGQLLTYDFEHGGRGYLGDKWSYAVGLSYGYSHPISRRLNLDFSIGIGYLGGNYQEYLPMDDSYVWQSTKKRKWFGPTNAEVSLVWLLGHGNVNKKKGGRR